MKKNPNDIIDRIGFPSEREYKKKGKKKPNQYTIHLQIQLSQGQKHILEVKNSDNPSTIADQFCQQHDLNKLAIVIIQNKIREAMEMQEQKNQKSSKRSISRFKYEQSTSNRRKREQQHGNGLKTKDKNWNNTEISPLKQKPKKSLSEEACNQIYLRSMVKARILEEQRNKLKEELQKKQQEKFTFKPKLNDVSEKIVQLIRTNQIEKKKKLSPTPKQNIQDQLKECTFKPQINKVSQRMVNNKTLIKEQKYNKTFKEETLNKSKQIHDNQQFSFQPQINAKSADKIQTTFFKRLEIDEHKRSRDANNQHYFDEEQCSFQPKVGRGPLKYRNQDNLNIWDCLHYGIMKNQNAHNNIKSRESQKISKQGLTNQQYYDNLLQETINKVFKILDSDNDGIISCNQIAIDQIPSSCLNFLKPIFMQIDQINAKLYYHEFRNAVHALFADSDPGSKGVFLSSKWKKQKIKQQFFQPSINRQSKQIQASRSVENLYKDGLKEIKNRQEKLVIERTIKEKKQMAQCSFQPILNRSSKVYIEKVAKRGNKIKVHQSTSEVLNNLSDKNKENDQKGVKSVIIEEHQIYSNDQ